MASAGKLSSLAQRPQVTEETSRKQVSLYDNLPISGEATRLIILHPGSFESPAKITLSAASLDDNPYYEALSYAWGETQPAQYVEVNHHRFEVRPNLYDA